MMATASSALPPPSGPRRAGARGEEQGAPGSPQEDRPVGPPSLNGGAGGGGRAPRGQRGDEEAGRGAAAGGGVGGPPRPSGAPPGAEAAPAAPSSSPPPSSSGAAGGVASLFSGGGGGAGGAATNFHGQLQEQIDGTIRPAVLNFFYPTSRRRGWRGRGAGRRQIVAASAAESSDDDDDVDDYRRPGCGDGAAAEGGGGGGGEGEAQEQGYYDERQAKEDRRFVHHFWRTYDDIIILSIFTQLGILFRLAVATYFTFFDSVFSNDSALFVNLPLNALSCFIMGLLSNGERLMEIVATRFTPTRLQQDVVRDVLDDDDEEEEDTEGEGGEYGDDDRGSGAAAATSPVPTATTASSASPKPRSPSMTEIHDPPHQALSVLRRRRRRSSSRDGAGDGISGPALSPGRRTSSRPRKRRSYFHSWQPPVHLDSELREVQLLALERRIRASKCLLLFPVRKEDFDLMEHYFESGYKSDRGHRGGSRRIAIGGPGEDHDDDEDDDDKYGDDTHDGDDSQGQSFSSFSGRAADLTYDLELQVELDGGGAGGGRAASPAVGVRNGRRHVTFQDDNGPNSRRGSPTRSDRRPKHQRDRLQQDVAVRHRELYHRHDDHDDEERMMVAVPLDAGSVSAHQHGPVTQSALSSPRDPIPRASAPAQNGVHVTSATDDGSTDANAPPLSPQPAESAGAATSASAPPPADDNLMVEEFFQDMHANVTENISRLQRVNLADGWDVGTTPDDMSDDLMLGLRDGFCGALSSFSSWNSAMVGLMRANRIGEAFVGYVLGIQLPIVAYRFGQHVAVFVFIWRCRFETRRDERRGYGIRLSTNEVSERDSDDGEAENDGDREPGSNGPESSERKIPSVRAVATALFVIALVTQCTSLTFFSDPEKQLVALSLLFSPLGVLARWRLSRLNAWRPTFPLGTFASNIIACMLSGSLGQLLAGNPGPRERIVLVSIISGFGGTLSSLAAFIVEILAGIDPVLFRFDGFFYAFASIFWAWLVGFLFSATADWADQTTSQ